MTPDFAAHYFALAINSGNASVLESILYPTVTFKSSFDNTEINGRSHVIAHLQSMLEAYNDSSTYLSSQLASIDLTRPCAMLKKGEQALPLALVFFKCEGESVLQVELVSPDVNGKVWPAGIQPSSLDEIPENILPSVKSPLLRFFQGTGREDKNRLLWECQQNLLSKADEHMNMMPWVFPLPDAAPGYRANLSGPDLAAFRGTLSLAMALQKNVLFYLEYLGLHLGFEDGLPIIELDESLSPESRFWLSPESQHHAVLTRVLQMLKLVRQMDTGLVLQDALMKMAETWPQAFSRNTLENWERVKFAGTISRQEKSEAVRMPAVVKAG